MSQIEEFNEYRSRMNDKILESDNLVLKRLFNLDTRTYEAGALAVPVKEM